MSKQFSDLGISAPILKAISEMEIVEPTEIQQKTIPLLLSNTTILLVLPKQELVKQLLLDCHYCN